MDRGQTGSPGRIGWRLRSTVGYYRRDRARVGYEPGTDFFTATTSGPIFGELLSAACVKLLGDNRRSRNYTFVEIGAETDGGVLAGISHPFGAVRTIRVGKPPALDGRCVVFSNELFDAQPFRALSFAPRVARTRRRAPREALLEFEFAATTPAPTRPLPSIAPDGYIIDAPLAAVALAGQIATQPWTGLFVACDYGKSWRELTEATPAGTARAYFRHTQSNDLLARPGEQTSLAHVCWDWLAEALAGAGAGFASPRVESQEAFFIHHAAPFIAATSAPKPRSSASGNWRSCSSSTRLISGRNSKSCMRYGTEFSAQKFPLLRLGPTFYL